MSKSSVSASTVEFLANELVAYAGRTYAAELVGAKLGELGEQVGRKMAERMTREKGRFASDLETVRFICKEFWTELSGKTADGLRTDKKGTYQVEDKSFRFLKRLSAAADVNVNDEAMRFLLMPCGIIKGALLQLGFEGVSVKCQIIALPAVKFIIHVSTNSK